MVQVRNAVQTPNMTSELHSLRTCAGLAINTLLARSHAGAQRKRGHLPHVRNRGSVETNAALRSAEATTIIEGRCLFTPQMPAATGIGLRRALRRRPASVSAYSGYQANLT